MYFYSIMNRKFHCEKYNIIELKWKKIKNYDKVSPVSKLVLRFGQPRGDLFFITLATKEIKDINQLRIGSTLFSVEHITFLLSSLPFRLLKLLPLVYPIIYHSRLEIENLTFVRGS